MKVNQAELVISAVSETQYPTDGLPEIALAGRSNVGKSSFVNKMINRKNLAYTSSQPGKTRTLNFYRINDVFHFVDVPGYGYAKVSKTERDKWGAMMETYFQSRKPLKGVFQIVDARHDPTHNDQLMYQYVKHFDLPVVIIATKLDKVSKSKQAKHLKTIKSELELAQGDELVGFSTESGAGKDIAWRYLEQLIGIKK